MSSLVGLINQVITEHGSAEIQARHILLLKTEAVILEKKTLALETEKAVCDKKISALESEIINLKAVIQDYENRAKISEESNKKPSHDNLPDSQVRILAMLTSSGMHEKDIIKELDVRAESVRYDLEELRLAGLVNIVAIMEVTFISLTHEGRKYLKKLGVI